jgi:putative endonuclease
MFYNYAIQSLKNKEIYIGYTDNLRKRLKEHNQGMVKSTKLYVPWKLIYYETCLDKEDTLRREHYLKITQGQCLLKRRLKFLQKTNKSKFYYGVNKCFYRPGLSPWFHILINDLRIL